MLHQLRGIKMLRLSNVLVLFCVFFNSLLHAEIPKELVARMKPSIVSIEYTTSIGINSEATGRFVASGFVVDAAHGIIATNRHVTGTSPQKYKLIFSNGDTTDAKLLYYDAWHDFGFLQYEPNSISLKPPDMVLGTSSSLHEQDEVFIIGNNDAQEYSVKYGRITNLVLKEGERHSASLQTSFDQTGGSSGSPVINMKGEVVAIHYRGSDTTSIELKIDYLRDAINMIQAGKPIIRGEAGLILNHVLISEARTRLKLPAIIVDTIKLAHPGIKRMIMLGAGIPGFVAAEKLMPGDLIISISGRSLGDDLYLADKLIDDATGKMIQMQIYRGGHELSVTLPVKDAEGYKCHRFLQFAGGVIQMPTPSIRYWFNIPGEGVFMTLAGSGTSMFNLGSGYRIVIQAVNGIPTPDLDAFSRVVTSLKDGDKIYLNIMDKNSLSSYPYVGFIDLDLRYHPFRESVWSDKDNEWHVVDEKGK